MLPIFFKMIAFHWLRGLTYEFQYLIALRAKLSSSILHVAAAVATYNRKKRVKWRKYFLFLFLRLSPSVVVRQASSKDARLKPFLVLNSNDEKFKNVAIFT